VTSRPVPAVALWQQRCAGLRQVFTTAGFFLFQAVMLGWVLCPGRKTVIGIYRMADPAMERAHDAFHRFVRCGAWDIQELWHAMAVALVASLVPSGRINVDIDDTLLHKSGRHVSGAGWWRDAVRSTSRRVVIALGLNIVVVTLRIRPPWGGEPLGLPICAVLHRKGDTKLTKLAANLLELVAAWFPDRQICCCADGAFASVLTPLGNKRITVISRIRRDAALYELKPKPTGQRGRPRTRGARLGTPLQIAAKAKRWKMVVTDQRGRPKKRLVYSRVVLWHAVSDKPVLLVISRDPDGKEHDDFWVCSDVDMPPRDVVSAYTGRWSIEDTFRATKQSLGIQHPQTWTRSGPERAATLGFLLYSLTWWWFLGLPPKQQSVTAPAWYAQKTTPSFADALAALRGGIWRNRIYDNSDQNGISGEIIEAMLDALGRAA